MIFFTALLFIFACAGWSAFAIQRTQMKWRLIAAKESLTTIERVGKWYELRIHDLENEARQLAEQVIASGQLAVRPAMPSPPPDADMVYLTDPTGLVRDAVPSAEYYGE